MIWVVNFPFCNFFSLERYLRVRSHPYRLLTIADQLEPQDILLLPGVGTFAQGMDYLRASNLANAIVQHASAGGRIVGICLGMQMLLQASSESPGVVGLSLIAGVCERIPASSKFSVPHIGWNRLVFPESLHQCFLPFGKPSGYSKADYYFVHSYHVIPECPFAIAAAFEHPAGHLAAAIATNKIIGFQFHPEKSGPAGYALLDHVLNL
ncbi:imidazole glycerol phosphate synthase subunit HisH [Microcystis elabens FACHB-917]|nr:imidazole glycerol phosphate synthase subunit HisH [Microcystis elabens FACHB-917]